MQKIKTWLPSWGGFLLAGLFFLLGVLLSSLVSVLLVSKGWAMDVIMLISYPLMFVPLLALVLIMGNLPKSRTMYLDSGRVSLGHCLVVMLLTLSLGFMSDSLSSLLPPMPEELSRALEIATEGRFWVNFLSVCILAPIFEEWLCRGLVLRGLLERGCRNWIAILLSGFFFAAIHGNLWQGLPALLLGCLFGYVYYRTGSLKLTVLMHFINNFVSLLFSQFGSFEADDTYFSILPAQWYWLIFACCALLLVLGIRFLERHNIVDAENVGSLPEGK